MSTEYTYDAASDIYANESYEIAKTKLNPRTFGSLGGVYWPHSHVHPRVRSEIYYTEYLKLFADEIPIIPSTVSYGTLNGEMLNFVIESKYSDHVPTLYLEDNGSAFGVWPPYPSPGGGIPPWGSSLNNAPHTFRDKTSQFINFMVFSSQFGPRWDSTVGYYNPYGIPQVYSTSQWYAAGRNYDRVVERVAHMNVIKTSYYAENCATPLVEAGDLNFAGDFIKLIYNTNDPADGIDPRQSAIINSVGTTSVAADQVRIHYNRFYEEMTVFPLQRRDLKKRFGAFDLTIPTLKAYTGIIMDEMRDLSKKIKLMQSRENRLFLRNSQPNTLMPKDLGRLTSYVEYNSKILSMLETVSLVGGRSRTASVYDPPSSPTGGSY